MGIDPSTVGKWRDRFAAEGEAGLQDRSSRPHCSPTRLDGQAEAEIEGLRRQRLSGPAIARQARRPVSTVGAVLRRLGLGRLTSLDPKPPVIRYERERPGELIHIDTKKLGRIDGIGHRITGDRRGQSRKRGTAGRRSTSPSMTRAGSPTPRSSPTSDRTAQRRSWPGREPGLPVTASRSSGS
jgi:hypothetical protein